jgi:hypothetical protein
MDKILDLSEGQPELAIVKGQALWAQSDPPLAETVAILPVSVDAK